MAVPEPVARVVDTMSTFVAEWFLCGGWAVDAWIGRQTRDHADLDIAVFHDDQRAIFDHLAGWQLIGHDDQVDDDSTEPWDGRRLELPAHIHARSQDGSELEVVLNDRSGDDWIFSREPHISLPLPRCTQLSAWGLPAVGPEVILFYKAHPPVWRDDPPSELRPHDELDFLGLLPELSEKQRGWLREAISLVRPGHSWLSRLSR